MISGNLLGALGKIRQAEAVSNKVSENHAIKQANQAVMETKLNLSDMQERIINYLGAGISAEKVASAVGCEPSYISQMLANEDIARAVSAKKLGELSAITERDRKLDGLEDTLIAKAELALSSPFACVKPMEAIRALHTINSLKRRGDAINQHVNTGAVTVKISLPQITMLQFTVDVNNQVIKADDTSLVTIASGQVAGLSESTLADVIKQEALDNKPVHWRQRSKEILSELTIEDLE